MVTIPEHMRAYQLIGHGGPEMLRLVPDARTPKTSSGEVLIHVRAAGLNNTDINTRVGCITYVTKIIKTRRTR